MSRLRVATDYPTEVLHDAVDDGQSQSSTLSRILRSEIGLKHSGLLLLRHAATRVGNVDQRIAARLGTGEIRRVLFTQFGAAGRNRQRASFRHRIARVNT